VPFGSLAAEARCQSVIDASLRWIPDGRAATT